MNKYELPAIEVSEISLEDIVTTSTGITGGEGNGNFGGGGTGED